MFAIYKGKSKPTIPPVQVEGEEEKRVGRKPGTHYLKPMDMEKFISEMDCLHIYVENPEIEKLTLVENPYLRSSLVRADYDKKQIEMSAIIMKDTKAKQREMFIRALCHFLAMQFFNEPGQGDAYKLFVKRYLNKKAKNKLPRGAMSIGKVATH